MKTNLPASFIQSIKKSLAKKEKTLETEQQLLIDGDPYMQEGRDADNEYLDDVQEDIEKEITDLRLKGVKDMMLRVKKTLAKIKIGKYGTCDICGKDIKKARLKAYPTASKCVECAKEQS